MLNFDYTLNITKPKVILQKQQDYLTKGNGIRELGFNYRDPREIITTKTH